MGREGGEHTGQSIPTCHGCQTRSSHSPFSVKCTLPLIFTDTLVSHSKCLPSLSSDHTGPLKHICSRHPYYTTTYCLAPPPNSLFLPN